jgi:hypothetical protein
LGLIFLGASLAALAVTFYRSRPPRDVITINVPEDELQSSHLIATAPSSLQVMLMIDPTGYDQAGQRINVTYIIVNVGDIAVDTSQVLIVDSRLDAPLSCQAPGTTLAPTQSYSCSATYIITEADLSAAVLNSKVSLQDGGSTLSDIHITIANTNPPSGPSPTVTITATASPTLPATLTVQAPISTPSPEPTIILEADWPTRLEVRQSGTIRVSLIRTSESTFTTTVEVAERQSSSSTPISVGTPGVALGAAKGPEYEAYVTARLAAPAFDATLASPETQLLDQTRNTWKWTIISENANLHEVNASISVHWKLKDSGSQSTETNEFEPVIWETDPPIKIEVFEPLITTGQLNIFALVTGFIGSGLSVPFIYGIIQVQGKKTQEKGKGKQPRR